MLQPCAFCMVTHTPANLWCALSMGMPEESPVPEMSGGCGLSKCDHGFCACDMRAYDKEFKARMRARVDMYKSQLELHDSLMRRAAAELVSRAVGDALNAFVNDPVNHPAPGLMTGCIFLDSAEHTLDPVELLLTTEMLNDDRVWPIEQVVTELSQAAQMQPADLKWQQLTGEKSFSPGSSTGGAQSISNASRSEPKAEDDMHVPMCITGELARAEHHPSAGFACGGAHDTGSSGIEPRVPIDDFTTTDSELGTCIGMCDTGHCAIMEGG